MAELNHADMVAMRHAMTASTPLPQAVSGTMNGVEGIPEPWPCERCGAQIWVVDVIDNNGDHIVAVVERCTEYPPEEEVFWAHVCGQ